MSIFKPFLLTLLACTHLHANPIPVQQKIGNFSFTVTDFNIQVGGLPLQVNRTYSTLQRFDELDFGYGWSIDYQNAKLQENIHPGQDWKMTPDTLIGSCFKFDKDHIVSIALPDGTTEKFKFKFARECGHYFEGSFYNALFSFHLSRGGMRKGF